jgi:outer membrane lipoprotein-sorting protein
MARVFLILFAIVALAATPCLAEPSSVESKDVIQRYLAASEAQSQSRAASMEISIDASIPKLKKEGKLHALRKISQLGKITYKFLGFQGDDTIKTEVIARYLEADQKGQDSGKFAITPENYKFKFKGMHTLQNGQQIYVIFLTPRRKEVGLFKGEMWLDAETYLPVMESGKLVKSPSVFFKKVEFMRDFKIEKGIAVPQHMLSTIEARLIGKVNLTVNYTGYQPGNGETPEPTGTTTTSSAHPAPSVVK